MTTARLPGRFNRTGGERIDTCTHPELEADMVAAYHAAAREYDISALLATLLVMAFAAVSFIVQLSRGEA